MRFVEVRPTADMLCCNLDIDISKLDESELMDLNQRIAARLKYLQEARTSQQMLSFSVGDRVTFQPPGHTPKTGVIQMYKPDIVTIVTDDQHQWDIAPVFISRVMMSNQPDESAKP